MYQFNNKLMNIIDIPTYVYGSVEVTQVLACAGRVVRRCRASAVSRKDERGGP
jgi:hypothetical protein